MRIVILGPPGAGKGTQAKLLAEDANIVHISTGDMLRAAIANETELGKKVKEILDAGDLVPDDVMLGIIKDRLQESDCDNGFLLDGFPRTVPQAEGLTTLLSEISKELTHVIDVVVAEEELLDRIEKRGADSGRSDDTREVALNRLQVYKDLTAPVSGYYKDLGSIQEIEGVGSVEEVRARIHSAVGLS